MKKVREGFGIADFIKIGAVVLFAALIIALGKAQYDKSQTNTGKLDTQVTNAIDNAVK